MRSQQLVALFSGVSALIAPLPRWESRRRDSGGAAGKARLLPEPARRRIFWASTTPMVRPASYVRPWPLLRFKQGDTLFARLSTRRSAVDLHWRHARRQCDGRSCPTHQAPVAPGASFDYHHALNDADSSAIGPASFAHGRTDGGGLKSRRRRRSDAARQRRRSRRSARRLALDSKGVLEGDFANPARRAARANRRLLAVNGARAPETHIWRRSRASAAAGNLAMRGSWCCPSRREPYVVAIDSQPATLRAGAPEHSGRAGARFE